MSKILGFCLFVCGIILYLLLMPMLKALLHHDPVAALLLLGITVCLLLAGVLQFFLPYKAG